MIHPVCLGSAYRAGAPVSALPRVYLFPVTFLDHWLPYLHGGSRYR